MVRRPLRVPLSRLRGAMPTKVDANKSKAYFQNSILLDDFIFPPPRLNLADDAGFDNPGNCSSFSGGRTGRPMLPCDLAIKKSSICPVLFRMNYVHTHTSN